MTNVDKILHSKLPDSHDAASAEGRPVVSADDGGKNLPNDAF
jgi:hypothetical protein